MKWCMESSLRNRIGIDLGTEMTIKKSIEWAMNNDVKYIDVCLDEHLSDPPENFSRDKDWIIEKCNKHDISLGLHTVSSVNVASTAPYVSEGVDNYLQAYLEVGESINADRMIIHGGYHFGDDGKILDNSLDTHGRRTSASIERISRLANSVSESGPTLLLENLFREPDIDGLKYIPVTLDECKTYFEALESQGVRWCFNPPHSRLFPEGMDGYFESLGVDLTDQVRINDNNGTIEEHLIPGEGTIDFETLFEMIESEGYEGHYMLKFGTIDDMLEGREYLIDKLI